MGTHIMRGLQIIVAFSALVAVGYAIKCHQCNSHVNPECAKYDDSGAYIGQGTIKDCPAGEKYCRKILQVVRDEESIIRTCGSEEHRKAAGVEEGCNGASAFSAVSALTAVLTAIAAHRLF